MTVNIPKIMWHIWIGPNPAPTKWMKTWKEKHPNWGYIIFNNDMLSATTFRNQHLIEEYLNRKKYNGVADLIRYELLYSHGGFCPPADAICLENTDELWNEGDEFCYSVRDTVGSISPIYACNRKNEFLKVIIDRLNLLSPEDLSDSPWESTGNYFLRDLMEEYNPKIKIFPTHYFIPRHFKAKSPRYNGPDKVYADQMWATTKNLYHQGIE
jgi:mannosyltransferase OCH1-like enzyme